MREGINVVRKGYCQTR